MICTVQDGYMKTLIRSLEMLWRVKLNDGTVVYSDYNRPEINEAPWVRLKKYCSDTGLYPVKIEALMFGAPTLVMAENEAGLDGVFILRGSAKDYDSETGEGTSYRHLIVGVLDDEKDIINVTKFSWPANSLDPFNQTRLVTKENAELMFFKNGSEKINREVIRLALNGGNV
jgi:hypothetical protein